MTFRLFGFPFVYTFNVLDEGYSRNTSCAVNYISTFVTKYVWYSSKPKSRQHIWVVCYPNMIWLGLIIKVMETEDAIKNIQSRGKKSGVNPGAREG